MATILVIHGSNLNLLGKREPEVYGTTTLEQINASLSTLAESLGHRILFYQSNAEHELIERLHQAREEQLDFILINPGALTHTSIALRDAVLAAEIPFIEVHISNIFAREPFRQHSYLSDCAVGIISGLGVQGYGLALRSVDELLGPRK